MGRTPKHTIPFVCALLSLMLSFASVQGQESAVGGASTSPFERAADSALQEMKRLAEERKMRGAAVVAFLPGESTTAWTSRMQVVGAFVLGKANVLGIAYSKAAEMADTLKDSGGGQRPPLRGEYGYKGGVIQRVASGYVLAVFSGGKDTDDIAVAQAGLALLAKAYVDPPTSK